MYRFAREPRWIVSHLVVLALVAAMVSAGLWQLHRRDDRLAENQRVEARGELPAEPYDDVVAQGTVDDVAYRRVTASGTFDPDAQVLIANRTLDAVPGYWVFTLLDRPDGPPIVVNRGFAARALVQQQPASAYAAPTGPVEVEGIVIASVDGASAGETEGRVELNRPDTAAFGELVGTDVEPAVLQAATSDSPALTALAPPDRGDGPHLSYAAQWGIFALIALVGYPLILRRRAHAGDGSPLRRSRAAAAVSRSKAG